MNHSLEHSKQASKGQASHKELHNTLAFPSQTIVHAKLEMTEPGDRDEQEADAVANAVVGGEKISRMISTSGSYTSGISVSQQMESQLSQLQGSGRHMPDGLRNMMETGFGRDFSQVRLHTDSDAASMSRSIQAKAFTHGNDIYFNQGQFSPETTEGQHLVAHELTHVVQGTTKVRREVSQTATNSTGLDSIVYPEFLKLSDEQAISALIDHLISTAVNEKGYLEKNSKKGQIALQEIQKIRDRENISKDERDKLEKKHWAIIKQLQLEDKSISNSKDIKDGNGNFTKYQQDLDQHWAQGQAWCDWFVHWCFVKAFNPIDFKDRKKKDNNFYAVRNKILQFTMHENDEMHGSVRETIDDFGDDAILNPAVINNENFAVKEEYKSRKTILENNLKQNLSSPNKISSPRKGDVFFLDGHIGLVVRVNSEDIDTIEGNTDSGGSHEGNGVYEKKRPLQTILGYGRPDYSGLLGYLRSVYDKQLYKK